MESLNFPILCLAKKNIEKITFLLGKDMNFVGQQVHIDYELMKRRR